MHNLGENGPCTDGVCGAVSLAGLVCGLQFGIQNVCGAAYICF